MRRCKGSVARMRSPRRRGALQQCHVRGRAGSLPAIRRFARYQGASLSWDQAAKLVSKRVQTEARKRKYEALVGYIVPDRAVCCLASSQRITCLSDVCQMCARSCSPRLATKSCTSSSGCTIHTRRPTSYAGVSYQSLRNELKVERATRDCVGG